VAGAWEDDSGVGPDSNAAIRLQAFDASGAKIGGETVVNTTTTGLQTEPSVSALADGRVVVTWTDASASGGDTSGTAVRMQIIDPRDSDLDAPLLSAAANDAPCPVFRPRMRAARPRYRRRVSGTTSSARRDAAAWAN
jgi:hypothetical protein